MNRNILLSVLVAVLLTTAACVAAPLTLEGSGEIGPDGGDAAAQHTIAAVETHPSQGDVVEIDGAAAQLFATDDGVTMSFRTSQLAPGHVHTAWWVIVNNPEACEAVPCTAPEILGESDAVESEITYADGVMVGDSGYGNFAAALPTGNVTMPWIGNGFMNPRGAEIHIVINDHGPLIADMAATMLNSYRGGCTDESLPKPFPDTAKADGEPGPNTCRLVQDAIFHQ